MNVLYAYGEQRVCKDASDAGIDGILAVDLPLEEQPEMLTPCRENGLCLIPLITPATPEERAKRILKNADGFVYYVSVRGITGARHELPHELKQQVSDIKKLSSIPIAVGFGIADGKTAHYVGSFADGVIVGSAFVKRCGDGSEGAFVKEIRESLNAAE